MKESEFYGSVAHGWSVSDREAVCNTILQELWPIVPLLEPFIGHQEVERLGSVVKSDATTRCQLVLGSRGLSVVEIDGEDPGGVSSALFDIAAVIVGACWYLEGGSTQSFTDAVGGLRSATNTVISLLEESSGSEDLSRRLCAWVTAFELAATAPNAQAEALSPLLADWRKAFAPAVELLWDSQPENRADGYPLASDRLGKTGPL